MNQRLVKFNSNPVRGRKKNVSKKLHTEPVLVNFEGAQQSIPSLAESIPAPIFLGDLRCFGQTPLGYPRIFLFLDDFVNTPGKVANPRLALGISKDHRVNITTMHHNLVILTCKYFVTQVLAV
jgi:hypothetical protein